MLEFDADSILVWIWSLLYIFRSESGRKSLRLSSTFTRKNGKSLVWQKSFPKTNKTESTSLVQVLGTRTFCCVMLISGSPYIDYFIHLHQSQIYSCSSRSYKRTIQLIGVLKSLVNVISNSMWHITFQTFSRITNGEPTLLVYCLY